MHCRCFRLRHLRIEIGSNRSNVPYVNFRLVGGHTIYSFVYVNNDRKLSGNKKINRKPSSGKSQEFVMLQEINEEDTSPSFRPVRFPKRLIFVEMFRRNLQSPV